MSLSSSRMQGLLMRDYYKYFSKYANGRVPDKKVAWVTALAPVEILDALDISYVYPESYAAVIAASEKEQKMLEESERCFLCRDCCSYACCIEGSLSLKDGPRGIPPKPDVLIATNNQCNTLPNWWNILALKYKLPLIVLDYPGESCDKEQAYSYVTAQHMDLIKQLEPLSGNTLDEKELSSRIENSLKSVLAWESLVSLLPKYQLSPSLLFDMISFLILSRCRPETSELYQIMEKEIEEFPERDKDMVPLYWLGYPLWYHPKRYLEDLLNGCSVVGSNYLSWWSLDYSGGDVFEQLFNAYNYTFLNLTHETKRSTLSDRIQGTGAKGAIVLKNKSCKNDFVSSLNINMPQIELEVDMIDSGFLNVKRAREQLSLFVESLCIS